MLVFLNFSAQIVLTKFEEVGIVLVVQALNINLFYTQQDTLIYFVYSFIHIYNNH